MKEKIRELALKHGFSACGFTSSSELTKEIAPLERWLSNGYHAQMNYMENHFEKRVNPSLLVEDAQTVISLLYNYYPKQKQRDDAPQIAKYAYGEDYHHVIKEKLHLLLKEINDTITPVQGRVFTDSAPLLERALARNAGLGWIGRNSLLITKERGSFFLLAELVIDLKIEPDQPFEKNYCGNCRKCIESCPTGAILENSTIDSNRCISYWTIEHKGDFSEETPQWNERLFGCDICQDVCPWNKKATPHSEEKFTPHPLLLSMTKEEWNEINEEQFREIFRKSAVKRTKFAGIQRNLRYLEE